MADLPRLSEREIDRLLAGEDPMDGAGDDLARLVRDLRAAYLAPPAEEVEVRHLAVMAEEARVAESEASPARSPSEKAHRRSRALVWKEATMTRIRTAALAVKLAAATLVVALATGGLAAAGVISLPNPLPGAAGERAQAVHDELQGSDPSPNRSTEAETQGSRGKGNSVGGGGDGGVQQDGRADPDQDKLRAFGDSVSDRATGGEPQQDGRAFGKSVSEEAQQLVPRPSPQPAPQGGPATGESFSQQGRENGESSAQGGRQTADHASGGRAP